MTDNLKSNETHEKCETCKWFESQIKNLTSNYKMHKGDSK